MCRLADVEVSSAKTEVCDCKDNETIDQLNKNNEVYS